MTPNDEMAVKAPAPTREDVLATLAEAMIAEGSLDPAAWSRALSVQAESGERLDRVMARLGVAEEARLAEAQAAALGLPYAPAEAFPTVPLDLGPVSLEFLKANELAPLSASDGVLSVAIADPFDDFAPRAVADTMGLSPAPAVAAAADVRSHLDRLYGDGARAAQVGAGPIDEDVERLRDLASEAPVIRLVNDLIDEALGAGASDLHLEPEHDRLRVCLRVDGVLRDHRALPAADANAVLSRVKIMARLDIAERRLPQDGRIKTVARGREIDLRVSTLPSIQGEAAVLRLLDGAGARPRLDALGLTAPEEKRLRGLLARPNGVVLVTGPTGSGKTTTLYAGLGELATGETKILTVEDPVEYRLKRAVQVQTKPDIGLDFAQALRAFLRHDPDVIMVGEIRDRETANIAVQAALTGHLVLSTLHTNSALGALVRLREMGVADYLLSASIVGVAAQRLLRRLCDRCRRPDTDAGWLSEPWARQAAAALGLSDMAPFYAPTGCQACGGTGYRGRAPVIEVAPMTGPIRRAVADGAELSEIEALARREGVASLRENALRLAARGHTSMAEVARAVRED